MRDARRSTAPATFGRYQTLLRIAAGGMAEVYAARALGEAGFEKLVAVKRMLPHLADDERFATMFMDEGRLAAHIDSPHVVSTIDLGRADDGSLFLVMELVIGTTLSVLLRNAAARSEPIPIGAACEMVAQAAQGLHDAHEARTPLGAPLELVHRDVSPQNILCGLDGRVRITDFGVARAVLRRTKSNTGELKGKLSYFSPEQCKNQLLDRRSDIFALGVVAWEALTCRPLFQSENPLAVLDRVMQMPIPAVSAVRAEVAEPISAVVARALERDRERRFQTAYEFASALRRAAVESLGSVDPRGISSLVERLGGDQLDRLRGSLTESLVSAGLPASVARDDLDHAGPDTAPDGAATRPDAQDSIATAPGTGGGIAHEAVTTPDAPPMRPLREDATPPALSDPPPADLGRPTRARARRLVAPLVVALGIGVGLAIGGSIDAGPSTPSSALPRTSAKPGDLASGPAAVVRTEQETAARVAGETEVEASAPEAASPGSIAPQPPQRPSRVRPRARARGSDRGSAAAQPSPSDPSPQEEQAPAPRRMYGVSSFDRDTQH